MSNLGIIFIASLGGVAILLWVKALEIKRGRRVILPTFRTWLDRVAEDVPVAISKEMRLFLARLSLKAHDVTAKSHDGMGWVRRFFRQYTIRLFASARTHDATRQGGSIAFPWK